MGDLADKIGWVTRAAYKCNKVVLPETKTQLQGEHNKVVISGHGSFRNKGSLPGTGSREPLVVTVTGGAQQILEKQRSDQEQGSLL